MTPSYTTEQERETILDKLEHWRFNVELECSGASLCEIESIAIGGAVLKLTDLHEILEWASAIVPWLRSPVGKGSEEGADWADTFADAIERGDHITPECE